jgi:hypothetical protein
MPLDDWQLLVLGGGISTVTSAVVQLVQGRRESSLQEKRFAHEREQQQEEWANQVARQQAEWDYQRQERVRQLDEDREREREVEVREALRELQVVMPVFNRASRAMYEESRSLYREAKDKGSTEDVVQATPRYVESANRFDDLDQQVRTLISRIDDEKIREAAGQLYQLDRHMALLAPSTWDSTQLYSGHDPVLLLVPSAHQLTRMIGKVLRGRPIDDEVVEDFVHGQD